MFVYELSGCGFESSHSHLNFRFRACFEQRDPWHAGKYRVWVHSEMRTWHDNNMHLVIDVWWWWIVLMVWLTVERCLALFSAGTINISSTSWISNMTQSLNLRSGVLEWNCAVVITTTPQCQPTNLAIS